MSVQAKLGTLTLACAWTAFKFQQQGCAWWVKTWWWSRLWQLSLLECCSWWLFISECMMMIMIKIIGIKLMFSDDEVNTASFQLLKLFHPHKIPLFSCSIHLCCQRLFVFPLFFFLFLYFFFFFLFFFFLFLSFFFLFLSFMLMLYLSFYSKKSESKMLKYLFGALSGHRLLISN